MFKPRLFVDMDGTLAEWKKIDLAISTEEESEPGEIQKQINDILYFPGYFKNLEPQLSVVNAIKTIMEKGDIEVFILSCALPGKETTYGYISPIKDKNVWLDKYFPEIDVFHRIFVPDGFDKKYFVPDGVRNTDFLLDDYTHNLRLWEETGTGHGIKILNGINSTHNSYQGPKIPITASSDKIAEEITKLINDVTKINNLNCEEEEDYLYE